MSLWVSPIYSQDKPSDARPAASPGKIYFVDGGRLATIQPDGRKPAQFPWVLAEFGHFQVYTARIAPDGRQLAFGLGEFRDRTMFPPSKIHVTDVAKGRDAKPIADLPDLQIGNWAWSPDGKKLAFWSWDAKHRTRNWIVDLQTKKTEEVQLPRVKTEQGEFQMSVEDWSPDGRFFVAAGDGVHIVGTDGLKARRLTPAKFLVHGGSCRFSPDGRKVLVVGAEEKKNEALYVAEVAGGKLAPIAQFLNFSDIHACWSPDGRRIAYSFTFLDAKGERGTESNLNVVDAEGQNSTTIVSANHPPEEIKLVLLGWR
jgi:Tol biopolymer transport system component